MTKTPVIPICWPLFLALGQVLSGCSSEPQKTSVSPRSNGWIGDWRVMNGVATRQPDLQMRDDQTCIIFGDKGKWAPLHKNFIVVRVSKPSSLTPMSTIKGLKTDESGVDAILIHYDPVDDQIHILKQTNKGVVGSVDLARVGSANDL